jgi:hypothetical protein
MAITITTLNGTDSVSSSRITINDNFSTVLNSLNKILAIIDTSTGKIKNVGYPGMLNNIETTDLTVTGAGGINVSTGGITLTAGNINLTAGKINLGTMTIERVTKSLVNSTTTLPTLNLSGTSATGGTGVSAYLTIPRLNTAVIQAIATPPIGSIVYDTTTNKLMVCTVSSATGTWTVVGSQS